MSFDRSVKIAPSILSADFADFGAECRAIEAEGCRLGPRRRDGRPLRAEPHLRPAALPARSGRHVRTLMDVHLMIAPVDPYIEAFAAAGADIITAHVEAGPHLHRTLQAIRAAGARPGVALNPGTPAEAAQPLLDMVDLVCVMTVNPGFGGQKFLHSQLDKIARAPRA